MSRKYRVGTGLPEFPTAGTEEQKQALLPIYRALNSLANLVSDLTGMTQIDKSDIQGLGALVQHDGYRTRQFVFESLANISYGQMIHLSTAAAQSKLRIADSSHAINLRCHGVCVEPGGISMFGWGRVLLFQGLVTGYSGLSSGTIYYLNGGGAITPTPPSGSTHNRQAVGIAINPTTLVFNTPLE